MIEIQLQNFFLIYVLICLTAVVILGVRDKVQKNNIQEFPSGDDLCICPLCDWVFLSRKAVTVRCPKCAAPFEVERPKHAS